jgi:hypothetical protein
MKENINGKFSIIVSKIKVPNHITIMQELKGLGGKMEFK